MCVWKTGTLGDPCKTETKPSPGIYVEHKHLAMGMGGSFPPQKDTRAPRGEVTCPPSGSWLAQR